VDSLHCGTGDRLHPQQLLLGSSPRSRKDYSPTVTDAYEMVTVASPSSWQGSCR
jgi:hypothetical protein